MFVRKAYTFSEIMPGFGKLCGDFALLLTRGALAVADCTMDRILYTTYQRRVYKRYGLWTYR
jgi:hypothetical protein